MPFCLHHYLHRLLLLTTLRLLLAVRLAAHGGAVPLALAPAPHSEHQLLLLLLRHGLLLIHTRLALGIASSSFRLHCGQQLHFCLHLQGQPALWSSSVMLSKREQTNCVAPAAQSTPPEPLGRIFSILRKSHSLLHRGHAERVFSHL